MPVERLPTSDGSSDEPHRVGDGLDRLLRNLGSPRSSTVVGIHDRWAEVVGPAMAGHTRPLRVRDGVLVVAVDDPVWATEVRWLGEELAAKVRTLLNDDSVKRIDVRVVGSEGAGGARGTPAGGG